MTIFDTLTRREIAEEAAPRRIVLFIAGAIQKIQGHRTANRVGVSIERSSVTLCRRSTGNHLEIVCEGPNAYRLNRSRGVQPRAVEPEHWLSEADVISLAELDRHVSVWLSDLRVVRTAGERGLTPKQPIGLTPSNAAEAESEHRFGAGEGGF